MKIDHSRANAATVFIPLVVAQHCEFHSPVVPHRGMSELSEPAMSVAS
jgi:hypothetical protein